MFDPISGEVLPIASSYGINEATCRALGIKIVQYSVTVPDEDGVPTKLPSKGCLSFDYHPAEGSLWGQKIRYKISETAKTFSLPHPAGKPPLRSEARRVGKECVSMCSSRATPEY